MTEAGCDNVDLLMHLRGVERSGQPSLYGEIHWRRLPGPHTRGCWAIDLILGKD